jgi:hypothetical protein
MGNKGKQENKLTNRKSSDDNEVVWSRTITPQSHISQRVVALFQVAHSKKREGDGMKYIVARHLG